MTPDRSRETRQAGFTLVEVVVAMALLGLLSSLAMPLMRGPPASSQLRADVTKMAAALRVTRAAAMAQNRDMTFLIDGAARSYASPVVPPSKVSDRIEVTTQLAASERRPSSTGAIKFFPSGRSTGGDVTFRTEAAVARLHVVWATGNVVVER